VDDVVTALLIRELFASGLSLARMRGAVSMFRYTFDSTSVYGALPETDCWLVILRNGDARVTWGDPAWERFEEPAQLVLSLSGIVRTAHELVAGWQRWRAGPIRDRCLQKPGALFRGSRHESAAG
jgi:hypothetical protein